MRILFFDTETNGLPKKFRAPPHDVANWPIILSIAWQLWDTTEWVLLDQQEKLIKPDESVVWDSSAEAIHKISRLKASTEGLPGVEVFPMFQTILRDCDVIVAHNISFDKSVLFAEMLRIDPRSRLDWWPRLEYCTCQNTTAVCKLPNARPRPDDPYKLPKLLELYTYLFGVSPDTSTLHTASGDVECLTRCFRELVRRDLIPINVWERSLRRV